VIFRETPRNFHLDGDRIFAVLMSVQWLGAIVIALWVSPRAWEGTESRVRVHVWAAIFIGGVITAFPVALALMRPGEVLTRHAIAIGEALMSALLIHLRRFRADDFDQRGSATNLENCPPTGAAGIRQH
jgi:hypothetical protein